MFIWLTGAESRAAPSAYFLTVQIITMDLQNLLAETSRIKQNFIDVSESNKSSYKLKAHAQKMVQYYNDIESCINQLTDHSKPSEDEIK